jgi:hypothetical protein
MLFPLIYSLQAASLPLWLCLLRVDFDIPSRFVIILLIKLVALLQIEKIFSAWSKKGRTTF